MPKEPVAQTDGRIKCSVCGAAVWRARFGSEWRFVEPAAVKPVPGSTGYVRDAGHVALTFPLVSDEPILGSITRGPTKYRVHKHAAFSAPALTGKRATR